ncbi:MAG TPA: MerR family transcriptional regulator [Candidatus Limnocylindrales bacterium]|nr:MerR family transcriptional regulator [Candidatus Limnocylindrales bacterium]
MSHLDTIPADPTETNTADARPLLRIHEVAALLGLTTRAIRYYEEVGLLEPAARSEGAYRLFDEDDVERLRFIKGLRDDAGFSLAEIGRLLEDEAARARNRLRFRTSRDTTERRTILDDAIARVNDQIASLREKQGRLAAMISEAEERRDHLLAHVAELDAGLEPAPHEHAPASVSRAAARPARKR